MQPLPARWNAGRQLSGARRQATCRHGAGLRKLALGYLQCYMAQMLSTHGPSVSLIANQFQLAGLIRYSRDHIHIINHAGLEEVCCECYTHVRDRFQRVLNIKRG